MFVSHRENRDVAEETCNNDQQNHRPGEPETQFIKNKPSEPETTVKNTFYLFKYVKKKFKFKFRLLQAETQMDQKTVKKKTQLGIIQLPKEAFVFTNFYSCCVYEKNFGSAWSKSLRNLTSCRKQE